MGARSTTGSDRTTGIGRVAVTLALALVVGAGSVVTQDRIAPPTAAAASVSDHDWRGVVNSYRAMSGLGPVAENATWNADARAHSRYMIRNGITHVQQPGNPGYSDRGRDAGLNGNVAVSSSPSWTARQFVELWLTGPFHAIGLLRHSLVSSGFGLESDPNGARWKSAATVDVLRGIDQNRPRPSEPIVFPGRDARTPLYRFIAETPNPVTLVGWTGDAGLPLIAMMPRSVNRAEATLTGPNGAVEVRVLHPANTSDSTARRVLEGDNAVVVVPRHHLANGRYTARVTSSGGDVTWSFTVDRDAPLPVAWTPPSGAGTPAVQPASPPAASTRALGGEVAFEPLTPHRFADSREPDRYPGRLLRLNANQPRTIAVADAGVTAISANFTVDRPAGQGYLTVFGSQGGTPVVSTLNFTNRPVANQAIVPVTNGSIRLVAPVATDVIIDVNGVFRPAAPGTAGFVPTVPVRVHDSREAGGALRAGDERRIQVRGVAGVPASATAVAVNLTVTGPDSSGYLQVWPGGSARPVVSNVNVRAGETQANSAIVPIGSDGTISVSASTRTHVVIDVTGHFAPGVAARFTALEPVRMLDTRVVGALNPFTGGQRLRAGQVVRLKIAGVQGVPANARAVSVNVTAVGATSRGFVTLFPGGSRPTASTLNADPAVPATANGAMVRLSADGTLSMYVHASMHVLVDINGVWR